jgi:pimeloyl-ACP methyl ester carboxylesterase
MAISEATVPSTWNGRFASVNGIRLHYVEAGTGPLVLLLHGFPEFWGSWRHQIPALADAGFRVLAPDLRGYNLSSKPAGVESYRVAELVGDVVGLIRHAGEERATVVGHDWGGAIAWATAMRRGERIHRLIILNAPHPAAYLRELRRPGQLLRSWYVFFFQLPLLPECLVRARDYALGGDGPAPPADAPRCVHRRGHSELQAGPRSTGRADRRDQLLSGSFSTWPRRAAANPTDRRSNASALGRTRSLSRQTIDGRPPTVGAQPAHRAFPGRQPLGPPRRPRAGEPVNPRLSANLSRRTVVPPEPILSGLFPHPAVAGPPGPEERLPAASIECEEEPSFARAPGLPAVHGGPLGRNR